MVDVTYSFEASLVVHEQSILGLHIQVTEAMLQLFTLHVKSTVEEHQSLMGRQIILKWSYLMIFMRVLVAVNVRWCKV